MIAEETALQGKGDVDAADGAMNEDGAPKRVLIADDDPDARALLTEIIEDHPSVELVASAKDAHEAIKLAAEASPDVAILDWRMPEGGGARAAKEITEKQPKIRVIALTGMDPMQPSYEMVYAGAHGFLGKGSSREQIIDALRSVTRW